MVINSFNFCLSGKLSISPCIINDKVAGWSILGCKLFPFTALNISCHCLLACKVSAQKSVYNLTGFPLCEAIFFPLAIPKILSLPLLFAILITVYLVLDLLGLILLGSLFASWIWMCFLPQIREFFNYYFFK